MSARVLNNFGLSDFIAANRVQVGRLQGFGRSTRLGAVNEISAEASVDVAIAVGETRVLMALLEELAKIDEAAYQRHVQHVQHLIQATAELNQQITTLTRDNVSQWRASLDHVNAEMSELEQTLHAALASGRTRRDIFAVGLTAGALLLAGVGGWYVFMRRRKRN